MLGIAAVPALAIACSAPSVRRDPPVPHEDPGKCEASDQLPAQCVSLADGQGLQAASRGRDECRFRAALESRSTKWHVAIDPDQRG